MVITHQVLFFFFIVQAAVVFSELPEIQKCKLQDSDCLKSSAQSVVAAFTAGIPEVDSESLDPLQVDIIKVDLAGLKLNLKDAKITGLKKAVIDKLNIDMDKKQMQLVFHADLVLKSLYKASGRLLILPITGDGQTVIKLKNCQLTMDFPFDIAKNKDGKDIIDLKSHTYKYDVKDGANFHLGNLFNGNKAASTTMHTFMNTSWKLLIQEFGIPIFNTPTKKVYNAIKAYLKSQPLEDITV